MLKGKYQISRGVKDPLPLFRRPWILTHQANSFVKIQRTFSLKFRHETWLCGSVNEVSLWVCFHETDRVAWT